MKLGGIDFKIFWVKWVIMVMGHRGSLEYLGTRGRWFGEVLGGGGGI